MKLNKKMAVILNMIVILIVLQGCTGTNDNGNATHSSPSVENMEENTDLEEEEVIKRAIEVCDKVRLEVEGINDIDSAMVYINYESVLVAIKLQDNDEEISRDLREKIEDKVIEIYPKAKTIAMSNDKNVYESISRLVKTFKENDVKQEFIRDMKEIIDKTI